MPIINNSYVTVILVIPISLHEYLLRVFENVSKFQNFHSLPLSLFKSYHDKP